MSHGAPCLWTRLPQSGRSPCDRFKLACCSWEGDVYVLGGRDTGYLRDFWRYSVVCNAWTELSCSGEAAPEELEEHSMVAHEGFLYVFGGALDSAYSRWQCPLWVFDIAKQKWVQRQAKACRPQTGTPSNRKGHSAVVDGSSMLLYGGLVDMKGSSQEFWSLDLDSLSWSRLCGSQPGSPGPGPRHNHSAASHLGCMYLFGGLKGLREQRDFWRWNSASQTWTSLKTKSGPSRLMGHSAVTHRDGMLLFGGGESQNDPQNCLWSFSYASQTWRQVAALDGAGAPYRIHHGCVGLGSGYGPGPKAGPASQGRGTRIRPFKNKCFPAPLTFLGSDGAIELQTFALRESDGGDRTEPERRAVQRSCLTFENKAFRKHWSCSDEDQDEEEDDDENINQHLPDLLLVLGGRPCSPSGPLAVWQMTLGDP